MATDNSSLQEAFARIASMLESSSQPGTAAPVTSPPVTTTSPGTAAPDTTATAPPFSSLQREEIAREVFYSLNLPLITRDTLLQMEKRLPAVIEELKSLEGRPAARERIKQTIEAIKQQASSTERSGGESEAHVAEFAEMLRSDAFGEGERLVGLIGLGIACFMATYTVANNWGR